MAEPTSRDWLAAVAAIREAGIAAQLSTVPVPLILGGTLAGDFAGSPLYHDAFNISYEPAGLVLRVEGGGQLVDELPMASLVEAVEQLIRSRRQKLAT